jgi:uncharacterized protein GlcG (DUF336 family)
MLTLLKARKIVDQALLRAKELNVSVSVAVCDTTGRLMALNQMDGSVGWEVDRCSMGKAVAAAITGRPSDQLFEQFGKGWPRLSSFSNAVVHPRGQRGGLPVVEAGIIQGGCGVSGAPTPEQDEECASAGIESIACLATAVPDSLVNLFDQPEIKLSKARLIPAQGPIAASAHISSQ